MAPKEKSGGGDKNIRSKKSSSKKNNKKFQLGCLKIRDFVFQKEQALLAFFSQPYASDSFT